MSGTTLVVNEIYCSIQGESTRMGLPCVFVRLAYCNLRCSWCDSEYTFYDGQEKTVDEVIQEVQGFNCPLVEITGGEPLLQPAVEPLMTALCDAGFEVLIETSGSLDIRRIDPRVRRIVDIKCPGSGMEYRNRWKNLETLRASDEVKFVIADRRDYEWAKRVLQEYALPQTCEVLFSPVFGHIENVVLVDWILEDHLPVRFQLQQHKYIWDPKQRGV